MTEPTKVLHELDPELSRLYRNHAIDQPSAAIDQHILAAAHRAISQESRAVRKLGWLQRWRLPLSLVATAVLSLSVVIQMEGPQDGTADSASRRDTAVPAAKVKAPASNALSLITPSTAPAVAPRATDQVRDAKPAQPPPDIALPSLGPSNERPNTVEDISSKESAVSAHSSLANGTLGSKSVISAAPVVGETVARDVKNQTENSRTPEMWLEEIRVLAAAGNVKEAKRALLEFEAAYPEYVLPEESRKIKEL